jgi:hypothetical protein
MEEKRSKPFFFEGRKRTRIITFSVCLLTAFVFWIFNALSNDYTTEINYPVKLHYNKNKIISLKSPQQQVSLAVTGYGWTLLSLTFGLDVDPILITPEDLNKEHTINSHALLEKSQDVLNDIRVNQVLSDFLYFDIDKLDSKTLMLKLDRRKLSLPAGKSITKPEIEPSSIVCSGPKNIISTLPDTISFSIPDSFIENNYDEIVKIHYKPSQYITLSDNDVRVRFNIK